MYVLGLIVILPGASAAMWPDELSLLVLAAAHLPPAETSSPQRRISSTPELPGSHRRHEELHPAKHGKSPGQIQESKIGDPLAPPRLAPSRSHDHEIIRPPVYISLPNKSSLDGMIQGCIIPVSAVPPSCPKPIMQHPHPSPPINIRVPVSFPPRSGKSSLRAPPRRKTFIPSPAGRAPPWLRNKAPGCDEAGLVWGRTCGMCLEGGPARVSGE